MEKGFPPVPVAGPPTDASQKFLDSWYRGEPPAGAQVKASTSSASREKNRGGAPRGVTPKGIDRAARKALATVRALKIIADAPRPVSPHEFATKMWPDSPRWKIPTKCGPYGCHRGGGMNLAAGGFLGKLAKRGLAVYYSSPRGWILTSKGRQVLDVAMSFAEVMK